MSSNAPGPLGAPLGPCPRCKSGLTPENEATSFHCQACTGTFIRRDVLERFLQGFQAVGPTGGYRTAAKPIDTPDSLRSRGAWEPEVRYLMCPMCTRPMTRQNFAKRSGILVDVCPPHGTWFDAGEARAVGEWIAQGGQIAEPKEPIARPKVDVIALLRR